MLQSVPIFIMPRANEVHLTKNVHIFFHAVGTSCTYKAK